MVYSRRNTAELPIMVSSQLKDDLLVVKPAEIVVHSLQKYLLEHTGNKFLF